MTSSGRDTSLERRRQIEALAADVGPMAHGIALRMLGDRASAEDALQDAYLQAFRGLSTFRGDASLKTWFLRILVNSCQRHRRVWRRWTSVTSQTSPGVEVAVEEQSTGDPALREKLRGAVLRLPHRQRTAFVLRYGQELALDEIAEVMGCATGTVKATLHKAVEKLRRSLGEELESSRGMS